MKKIKVKMNKPVYLRTSILDISKTLIYEIWYDYIKPKYRDNAKLCYMDNEIFIIYIKIEDFYEYTADDVKKWFDTSNYNVGRLLLNGMNKKVIGYFKDELGAKIMKELNSLRPKRYSYLMDDDGKHKKAKGTKKMCNKKKT